MSEPQVILSHLSLGVNDLERARVFYDAVLAELGITPGKSGQGFAGWGSPHAAGFFISTPLDGKPATAGNGVSVSLLAPTRDAVERFWRAALAAGGVDEGKPGLRPHYHPNYYAAYVRDLDGNKVAAVCHEAA
jgi:catechol 2,3-dioxygenase-like lactoylglutathione lyase family enzyme